MLISTPTYKTFIMMYKVYLPFKQIIFEQLGGVSSLHNLQNIFIAFTKYIFLYCWQPLMVYVWSVYFIYKYSCL